MSYSLLYRGIIRYCNYQCDYCPFRSYFNPSDAQNIVIDEKRADFTEDKSRLAEFEAWVRSQISKYNIDISIFFIPAGEVMLLKYYRDTMLRLSKLPNIKKLVIQTNLSYPIDELNEIMEGAKQKIRLWITYHPEKTPLDQFLMKLSILTKNKIIFSIGVVGIKDNIPIIRELKSRLPKEQYLWVNAYKTNGYYSSDEIKIISDIDPNFKFELNPPDCTSKSCETGNSVFFIEGSEISRCVMDRKTIGSIPRDDLVKISKAVSCQSSICNCFIGYVHLKGIGMENIFGSNKLERIPKNDDLIL